MRTKRSVAPLTIEPDRPMSIGSLLSSAAGGAPSWTGGGALSSVRPKKWFTGGRGDFFSDLSWTNRPADLARSGAPQELQDAWTATVMALQEAHCGLRNGSCYHLNLAGAPLVQLVLGEPVVICAGYAAFVERRGIIQTGFRWRPGKWGDCIDASEGSHMEPLQDIHCWLEVGGYFLDLDGGIGADDIWPPMIYRPKAALPKHPRDVRNTGDILLWANAEARELVGAQIVPSAVPIASRAVELFETFVHGSPEARREAAMQHEWIMRFARSVAPQLTDR